MDLEDIIQYENESTYVDFKATQYIKGQYPSFIKDVMAMANANTLEKRFIIIGISEKAGQKEVVGINDQLVDAATYQQIIHENIEPEIDLKYYQHEFERKKFGVFEISGCIDPPYMMKKEFAPLKKGDCYIRKGTTQMRMTRRDYDIIYEQKVDARYFKEELEVYFQESGTTELVYKMPERFEIPSEVERNKLEAILEQRKQVGSSGPSMQLNVMRSRPEQKTNEELEKLLKATEENFKEADYYYIFETVALKFNIILSNLGTVYIEDASVEITIDKLEGFLVASDLPKQPRRPSDLTSMYISSFTSDSIPGEYPMVEEVNGKTTIKQHIGSIKHHVAEPVFMNAVRIAISPSLTGTAVPLYVKVFGKNLKTPLERQLVIKIE